MGLLIRFRQLGLLAEPDLHSPVLASSATSDETRRRRPRKGLRRECERWSSTDKRTPPESQTELQSWSVRGWDRLAAR
jgi:hypothetical protein